MTKIQWALDFIYDGHWHSIDAIRKSIDFSSFEIIELVTFLSEYNFITIDDVGLKVKITSDFRKLMMQTS
ncbi:MAG: hypothetical protein ACQCN3_13530 [Candidatus Bathyarchaeia archaeon]|jgi:hypothetical protein